MKRNLKKWVVKLLAIVNLLILTTLTNNDLIVDLILFLLFMFNGYLILKYDHKYLNIEGDYDRI